VSLTGPESIATLSAMERYFGKDGKNWTQDAYHRGDGTKCLVGAARSMRAAAIEDALYWVRLSIGELHPDWLPFGQIEDFNDSRASYTEIAEVIARAKQLAAAHSQASRAAEILPPPSRAALTHQPQERIEIITMADLERVAVRRRD
jgi:hypothetical protein